MLWINHPSGFQLFLWIKFSVQKEKVCHLIPNQNSCQVQLSMFWYIVDVLCFSSTPPKKNARFFIPRNMSCSISPRLRWGSGQGHWEQSETRPVKKHNDDIDNFVLEKKNGWLFVWSLKSGNWLFWTWSKESEKCLYVLLYFLVKIQLFVHILLGGGKNPMFRYCKCLASTLAFCSHSLGGGEKSNV